MPEKKGTAKETETAFWLDKNSTTTSIPPKKPRMRLSHTKRGPKRNRDRLVTQRKERHHRNLECAESEKETRGDDSMPTIKCASIKKSESTTQETEITIWPDKKSTAKETENTFGFEIKCTVKETETDKGGRYERKNKGWRKKTVTVDSVWGGFIATSWVPKFDSFGIPRSGGPGSKVSLGVRHQLHGGSRTGRGTGAHVKQTLRMFRSLKLRRRG